MYGNANIGSITNTLSTFCDNIIHLCLNYFFLSVTADMTENLMVLQCDNFIGDEVV